MCPVHALYKNAGFYKRLVLASNLILTNFEPNIVHAQKRFGNPTHSFDKKQISLFYVTQKTNQTILIIMVMEICLTVRLRLKICYKITGRIGWKVMGSKIKFKLNNTFLM